MESKKRLTKKEPSYYLPLPYAMAVKKIHSNQEMETYLFEGMTLSFHQEGLINVSIAVVASLDGRDYTIGYVPKGMVSRIVELMGFDDKITVSLEKVHCEQLPNAFWISIDELPELQDLGLKKI